MLYNWPQRIVMQSITELDFEVNFDTSRLEGNTCIEYIGFIVHTGSKVTWITVPEACLQKLREDIRHVSKKGDIKAQFLAWH